MPDYKTMYFKVFNALTDAEYQIESVVEGFKQTRRECEEMFTLLSTVERLKLAQQECEEIFMSDERPVIIYPDIEE